MSTISPNVRALAESVLAEAAVFIADANPELQTLPPDLARAGWIWEVGAAGMRLASPAEGFITAWYPIAGSTAGAIAEARAIAARDAAQLAAEEPTSTVIAAFDYAALAAETRIVVQQAAKEIRDEHDLMRASAIKIGRRLADVKAALPYGTWGTWLESEFGWSQQTATNYMRQAQLAGQNPKFLEFEDRIDPSARILLADPSTPEPARDEALARAEAGERVRHKDAREIVGAAKAEQAAPPAPSALNQRQRPAAHDEAAARAEEVASVLIVQLGGQYIGMADDGRYRVRWDDVGGAPVPYRLDELRRLHADAGYEPPDMTPDPEPAPPVQLLDQVGRQPYGAKGADRWQPIAPHVLIIEQRTHRYGPPPLVRAATIYDTPTTVRVRRPDGKEETQAQHKVWAVPTDAAWSEIEAARDAFGATLAAFAEELRQLGRYDKRLAANGGIKQVPDGPLCPSVARADDPDANNQSSWWLSAWHVPRLERTTITRHTAKMLASADIGSYIFAQSESWLLPDDATWSRISAARQDCSDAAFTVETLLKRLGTYEEATQRAADGQAAPLVEVSASEASITRDAFEDRLAGLRLQVEGMGYTLIANRWGLSVYEGAVMHVGVGAGNLDELERQIGMLVASREAKARYARAEDAALSDEAQTEHRDDDRIGGYIEIEEDDEITVSILADGLTQYAADAVALIANSLRLMARGKSHAVETGGLMQLAALLNRATSGHARGTLATILTMIAEDADALATTQPSPARCGRRSPPWARPTPTSRCC